MTLVSSDIPKLLLAGLKTAFFEQMAQPGALWDQVATLVPSDKDGEQYAWLGALPGVSEFVDERKIAEFPHEYDYAIRNKTWESTLAVDRTALEDDLYGQIALRVKGMAQSARQHLDLIVFGLLQQGFSSPCYDGQPLFGTHVQGGAQTNKGTAALSADALQTAITAMLRLKNDQGRPAGIMPNVLVVPPELQWEARQLLTSTFYPDPVAGANQLLADNPLKGLLKVLTCPYLDNPTNWFLLDTSRVVRALVLQMRKGFEFEALERNSENGFMRDQYLYGVRARYNAGFGDWRCAYGAQVS